MENYRVPENKALLVNHVVDNKHVVVSYLNGSFYREIYSATDLLSFIINLQEANYSIKFEYLIPKTKENTIQEILMSINS